MERMKARQEHDLHLESVLILGAGLSVFALVWSLPWVILGSAVLSLMAVVFPFAAKYIHLAWTGFGKILGAVNGFIILGVLFYVVLTPVALLKSLFKPSPFHKPAQDSFFHSQKRKYEPKDLENPW